MANIRQISVSNTIVGNLTMTHEAGDDIELSLINREYEGGRVDGNGTPLVTTKIVPKMCALPKIVNNPIQYPGGTIKYLENLQKSGTKSTVVISWDDGTVNKFLSANFTGPIKYNRMKDTISAEVQGDQNSK
jgi:hypothetical protein